MKIKKCEYLRIMNTRKRGMPKKSDVHIFGSHGVRDVTGKWEKESTNSSGDTSHRTYINTQKGFACQFEDF